MSYWAVLILTIVAMVAILLVFMWWWTTDNRDWADATLKAPRTVSHETEPNVPRQYKTNYKMESQLHTHSEPLKAYMDWASSELKPPRTVEYETEPRFSTRELFRRTDDLLERVKALERWREREFNYPPSQAGKNSVPATPSPSTDSLFGRTANETTPTPSKDASPDMEPIVAPTT